MEATRRKMSTRIVKIPVIQGSYSGDMAGAIFKVSINCIQPYPIKSSMPAAIKPATRNNERRLYQCVVFIGKIRQR
jgi:hypothetical protein